jgi:hypothetical protein
VQSSPGSGPHNRFLCQLNITRHHCRLSPHVLSCEDHQVQVSRERVEGPAQSDKRRSNIDMGDRYGRSDINEISIGISMRDMDYRYGIWYIDMVINHIDMVGLDIDMGYELMIWEMKVSIRSSPISIWDVLSLWRKALPRMWRWMASAEVWRRRREARSARSARRARTNR